MPTDEIPETVMPADAGPTATPGDAVTATEEPGRPSALPAAKTPHIRRMRRVACVTVGAAIALTVGAHALGLGGGSGSDGAATPPQTTISQPATPGQGGGASTPPASVAPSTSTAPALLPGTDLHVATTVDSASTFGATVVERLVVTVANDGQDASQPGTLDLSRGGQPVAIKGVLAEIQAADGSRSVGNVSVDGQGVATLPSVPGGAKLTLSVNYNYTGRSMAVTANVKVPGATMEPTSVPSVNEGLAN